MNTTANKGFRTDIAGLRAIAVIVVVLYHFGIPGFGGGFIGVDVFFVISGYLMTQILSGALARGSFSILDFYLARIRRIVPGLLVLCVFVVVFGWLRLVPPDFKELGSQVCNSILFVSNFDFLRQFGYFDQADHQSWMLHTWSLSVEWQFYLLYPLFLVALHRFVPGPGSARRWVDIVAFLSLLASIVVTPHRPNFAFYMIATRAWELLAGACVFLRLEQIPGIARWSSWLMAAGLLFIAISTVQFNASMQWPGCAACLPVGGAMLVLLARSQGSVLLGNPIAQFLGNSSYSIYLWHWPIFVALGVFQLGGQAVWTVIGIAASIAVGGLSYWLVETPGRKLFRRLRPVPELLAFAGAISIVVVAGGLVDASGGIPGRLRMRDYPSLAEAVTHSPTFADGWCVANDATQIDLKYDEKFIRCSAGDSSSEHTILLWGDSHAGHFAPMISLLATDAHLRLKVLSTPACFPLLQPDPKYTLGINPDVCLKYKDLVRATAGNYDYIVIAARWELVIGDKLVEPEFRETLRLLQNAGAKVVLLGQAPAFDKNPAKLYLYGRLFGYPLQTVLQASGRSRDANAKVSGYAGLYNRVVFVDPAGVLCLPASLNCRVILGGGELYADYDHLNTEGSVALAHLIIERQANFLKALSFDKTASSDLGPPPSRLTLSSF